MKKWMLSFLCISMCVSLFAGCSTSQNDVVATIKDKNITVEEFNAYLKQTKASMEQEFNKDKVKDFWTNPEMVKSAKEKALDEAVKEKVQLIKARDNAVSLTAEDLKTVDERKKQTISQIGDQAKFEQTLKTYGYTPKSFDELLKNQLTMQKLHEKIIKNDASFTISDADVLKYYNENKQKIDSTIVKAQHILILTTDQQQQPLPPEQQEVAKVKAEGLLKQIKAGADFVKLMNENTQDPGLKDNPTGYTFGKGKMDPAFESAAFALKEGEVSGLVQTNYGFHIIKRVPIDDMTEVKNMILKDKYDKLILDWKKELGDVKVNRPVFDNIKIETETPAPAPTVTEAPKQ